MSTGIHREFKYLNDSVCLKDVDFLLHILGNFKEKTCTEKC